MNTFTNIFITVVIFYSFFIVQPLSAANQGAITPFKTIEAETGILGGGAIIRSMTTLPNAPTPELEASGRAFVELNATGESVTMTNNTGITSNTLVVRASIPDAPTGGGITATLNLYVNGVFRQTLTFTSKYSWVYGVSTDWGDNNPASLIPHRFYDEMRTFITGAAIAPGSTITLQKDASNNADFYYIDLIDMENVAAAITQPANTLSVVSYGAISGDDADDSAAFIACIIDCQLEGKGMWIPAGSFHTQGIINVTGITISGAGMWYTSLYRIIGGRHKWNLTNCTLRDVYIFGNEVGRNLVQGHDYGMTAQGANGYLIERVWLHNVGAGFWLSGTDGIIQNCRTSNDWADGINLNNGSGINTNNLGLRLICQNNYVRGSTDDGIAINAQNGAGVSGNMVDTKILNNSSIATIYANGLRIAGGRNSLVQNNLITDPADLNGIQVGIFGTAGNPCESTLVSNNLIIRGGGFRGTNGGIKVSQEAVATIDSNTINDSHQAGIQILSCNSSFTNNVINHPATKGFLIDSSAKVSGVFTTNEVYNLNNGQIAFQNNAPTNFNATLNGNSWQGITLQAETALYGGPLVSYSNTGFNGTGFLDFINTSIDFVEWTVNVPTSGSYFLSFRYAQAAGNRPLELSLNGSIAITTFDFTSTGSWTTWGNVTTCQTLIAGENKVRLTAIGSSGCNIDELLIFGIGLNHQQTTKINGLTQNRIKIFPNPVRDILCIDGFERVKKILIFNLMGQVVLTDEYIQNIDVSKLTPGVYSLKIDSNNPVKFTKI